MVFADVQPGLVTVLADTADPWSRSGRAKALEAKKKAEEAMANQKARLHYAKAQAELMEAVAQLAAIQRLRKRGHDRAARSRAVQQKAVSTLAFFSTLSRSAPAIWRFDDGGSALSAFEPRDALVQARNRIAEPTTS